MANTVRVLLEILGRDRSGAKTLQALGAAADQTTKSFDAAQKAAKENADAIQRIGAASRAAAGERQRELADIRSARVARQENARLAREEAKAAQLAGREQAAAARQAIAAARQQAAAQRQAADEEARAAKAIEQAEAKRVATNKALLRAQEQHQAALQRATSGTNAFVKGEQAAASAAGTLLTALGALAALAVTGLSLQRFTSEGIGFNKLVETSTLGVAALISAEAKLTDAHGQELTGQAKLAAAYQLSTEQVLALRVAGLKTAATTEQLVDAFQQAVGAGLSAGESLDNIRKVTIGATQAAQALGVPLFQLSQEVRALFSGDIDQNARVAKALGITAADIARARETGKLAEFLLGRLRAFNDAGDAIARTFEGVQSNIKETLQVFAGDVTKPLFDSIKAAGQKALEGVFDLDSAKVDASFRGVEEVGQRIFGALGDLIGRAFAGAVDGARQLSKFLDENRTEVDGVLAGIGAVGSALGTTVATIAGIITGTVKWGVESRAVAIALGTVSNLILLIRNHLVLFTAIVAGPRLLGAITAIVAALRQAQIVATFSGGSSIAAVLAPLGGIATVATAAILALVVAIAAYNAAQDEARRVQEELNRQQGRAISTAPTLIQEYRDLGRAIEDGSLKGDALTAARKRQKEITDKLIALSPDYQKALETETHHAGEQADALERVNRALTENAHGKVTAAEARLDSLESQLATAQQEQATSIGKAADAADERVLRLLGQVKEARQEVTALHNAFPQFDKGALRLDPVVVSSPAGPTKVGTGNGEDPQKTLNDLKQSTSAQVSLIRNAAERAKAELERSHAEELTGYRQYYAAVAAVQERAIDAEIAAKERLLSATTDKGERAQLLAEIRDLGEKRLEVERTTSAAIAAADRQAFTSFQEAREQLLDRTNRTEEAQLSKLAREYAETVKRMLADSNFAGIGIASALFNVDVARAHLDGYVRSYQQAQDAIAAKVDQVRALQERGDLSDEEARKRVLALLRQQRQTLQTLLPGLEAAAQAAGDPASIANVDRLKTQLVEIDTQIRDLAQGWQFFAAASKRALKDDLSSFLGSTINQVHGVGDAFRSLAESVVSSLQRIVAQLIAAKIAAGTANLLGVLSFLSPSKTPADTLNLATGGFVQGPGSGTSDSIPARLSNGEFVVRAGVVQALGVDFFRAINGSRRLSVRGPDSVRRFAAGGLVTPGAAPAASESNLGRLHVSLAPGLVADYLRSTEGKRLIVETVQRHPKAFNRALGRG